MKQSPHVAIDGPVASGKTTVARAVARRLGALYLDTGVMYRAAALAVLRAGVDPASEAAVVAVLRASPVTVERDLRASLGCRVRCGGDDVSRELFTPAVDAVVSAVAAHPAVRREMVARQRAIADAGPTVMAGRDIGTVVLPQAPVKVYLTADARTRARRRVAELESAGIAAQPEAVFEALAERDRTDEGRPAGPLRPADGATVIDSSDLTPAEVVDRIVALARSTGSRGES